jgi:hypothetical protein
MPRGLASVCLCGIAIAGAVAGFTSNAEAHPQISSSLTTGAALTDLRFERGPRLAYHLGGRFDVLFLRSAPGDMALGPYVDVATHAFDTFETGGGLSWLVPAGSTAFVFSGGGFGRAAGFGFEPGVSGTIFWGSRSYNYHSTYGIGVGLIAQGRYGFGDGKQADAILGAQIDLEYLALPFLFAYEAITR